MEMVFLATARDKSSGAVCSIVLGIVGVSPNRHSDGIRGILQFNIVNNVLKISFQNEATGGHDHSVWRYVSGVLRLHCMHLSDATVPILNIVC